MVDEGVKAQFIKDVADRFPRDASDQARTWDFMVAGVRFRVHVSSRALGDFVYPALAWQQNSLLGSEPDIEIFAVEGEGVPSWLIGEIQETQLVRGPQTGEVLTTFDIRHSMLSMFDRVTSKGVFWLRSAANLPEWEFGAPLRSILTWALIDRGLYMVHSAGIGLSGRGVLVSGPGGSGKSTTTALSTQNGFHTTGDDYCAVSVGSKPEVYGVYGLLKLVPYSLGAAGLLDPVGIRERSDGKVHFPLQASMTTKLELTALLFTHVGRVTQDLVPITPRDALLRLIPSTYSQSSLPQPELFRAMSGLSQRTKAYQLEVGPDTEKVLGILEGLCAS